MLQLLLSASSIAVIIIGSILYDIMDYIHSCDDDNYNDDDGDNKLVSWIALSIYIVWCI